MLERRPWKILTEGADLFPGAPCRPGDGWIARVERLDAGIIHGQPADGPRGGTRAALGGIQRIADLEGGAGWQSLWRQPLAKE
jgi:hypothetical protein